MNFELEQEIGEDVVEKIKQQRIERRGHVWKAKDSRIKSMLIQKPRGQRRRRTPRLKWLNKVAEDLNRSSETENEG